MLTGLTSYNEHLPQSPYYTSQLHDDNLKKLKKKEHYEGNFTAALH